MYVKHRIISLGTGICIKVFITQEMDLDFN